MVILLISLTTVVTFLIGIITYLKWALKYWKSRNVPYETPKIPFGTMTSCVFLKESLGESVYNSYIQAKKSNFTRTGLFAFWRPMYMPIDLKIIKKMLGKDFTYFMDRGVYYNEKDDPISSHLFSIEGQKWKNLRAKLTPTFTSGKMKMMFPTLVECAENLKSAVNNLSSINEVLDISDIVERYTIDVIGSCAFGLECNSFKNPNSDFRKFGKKAFHTSLLQSVKIFIGFCNPHFARSLGISCVNREVSEFFMNVTKESVDYREKNNVKRNDFLHLLIELRNESRDRDKVNNVIKGLTIEDIAAQLFIFFVAGYETASATMTFCLYELASNVDIQERVREEINSVIEEHDGKITYESIANMKYLEQVIDETLRKYPPVPVLNRICVAEYKVPETNDVIEKNVPIFISTLGLHRDPDYFPEPEKFDPERFSEENKSKIIPFTYLPFGDGPRNCIGLRFGKMQVKVGLAMLFKNFKFVLNKKTASPLKYDPASFILSVLNGIWVNVSKVEM